jgi:hypothetical protein
MSKDDKDELISTWDDATLPLDGLLTAVSRSRRA